MKTSFVKRKKIANDLLCMFLKISFVSGHCFYKMFVTTLDLITIIITLERGNILLMKRRRSVSLSTVLDLSIVLLNYKRSHQRTMFKDDLFSRALYRNSE